jgi:hypothetical protein
MAHPEDERFDFRVRSRGAGLALTSRTRAVLDPGLLDPSSRKPWEQLQDRFEAISIVEGAEDGARVVIGELDWSEWDGLVDRAIWKLNLEDGELVIGGLTEGEHSLHIAPGRYWVTLYRFAEGEGVSLLHLQKVAEDGDFLRTSMDWMPEPTHDEPLVMGSEDTEEVLAMGGEETDDDDSDSLNINLSSRNR